MKKNRTYHKRGRLIDGFKCRQHPLYSTWASMMSRCYNPGAKAYRLYGARRIKVAERWHHFKNFASDMGMKPAKTWTLERKNNFSGYSKSNCVWAIRSDQNINRRVFKLNKVGATGIRRSSTGQYAVRFDYQGVRYRVGIFQTLYRAQIERARLIKSFQQDPSKTLRRLNPWTLWCTSSTKVRGVARHTDGGYLVRCTVDGIRHYVGYFKNLQEATRERDCFLKSQTC